MKLCKYLGLLIFILFLAPPSSFAQEKRSYVLLTGLPKNSFPFLVIEARLREAFRRNGFGFFLMHRPPKRALHDANRGKYDGDAHRIGNIKEIAPKLTGNLIKVPTYIFKGSITVFTHKGSSRTLKTWEDINRLKKKIGCIGGAKILEKTAPYTYLVNTRDQLFNMLAVHRFDAVLSSTFDAVYLAKNPRFNNIVGLTPPMLETVMYTYLHKKYRKFVPVLSETLKKMISEGFYDKTAKQIGIKVFETAD